MIVRTGEMSLVVEDVIGAKDEIAQLAASYDGYVISSQISGEEQDMRGYISIRVPDDRFESALAELRDLAVRVTSESTNSQDVTEEYVDLQSRLKNAEATESQYLALLGKATERPNAAGQSGFPPDAPCVRRKRRSERCSRMPPRQCERLLARSPPYV